MRAHPTQERGPLDDLGQSMISVICFSRIVARLRQSSETLCSIFGAPDSRFSRLP